MNIKDIIINDYYNLHELKLNDGCVYCEKPWHKRNISWFYGGIRLTLDYLSDNNRYTFKETMYLSNKPKYNCLSKIFIWNGPITNKYRISNFNKGYRGLHSFGRGLYDE